MNGMLDLRTATAGSANSPMDTPLRGGPGGPSLLPGIADLGDLGSLLQLDAPTQGKNFADRLAAVSAPPPAPPPAANAPAPRSDAAPAAAPAREVATPATDEEKGAKKGTRERPSDADAALAAATAGQGAAPIQPEAKREAQAATSGNTEAKASAVSASTGDGAAEAKSPILTVAVADPTGIVATTGAAAVAGKKAGFAEIAASLGAALNESGKPATSVPTSGNQGAAVKVADDAAKSALSADALGASLLHASTVAAATAHKPTPTSHSAARAVDALVYEQATRGLAAQGKAEHLAHAQADPAVTSAALGATTNAPSQRVGDAGQGPASPTLQAAVDQLVQTMAAATASRGGGGGPGAEPGDKGSAHDPFSALLADRLSSVAAALQGEPGSGEAAPTASSSAYSAAEARAAAMEAAEADPRQAGGSSRATIVVGDGADRVALTIAVAGHGVHVRAEAASSAAADAFMRAQSDLREALGTHGLQLQEVSAQSDTLADRGSHEGRGQSPEQRPPGTQQPPTQEGRRGATARTVTTMTGRGLRAVV